MNCIAGKAKNTSDVLVDNVQERYQKLHDHVIKMKNETEERMKKISDKLDDVRGKINSKHAFLLQIVRKINEFVDKCSSTMTDLNDKCESLFKCKFKRSAEAQEVTYLNFTEYNKTWKDVLFLPQGHDMTSAYLNKSDTNPWQSLDFRNKTNIAIVVPEDPILLPKLANSSNCIGNCTHQPDNATIHNVYYSKVLYHKHPQDNTVHSGKIFHVRKKRFFGLLICFFKTILGGVIKPMCKLIFYAMRFLCRLPKFLGHFITGIVLEKFKYVEQSIKQNTWIEVSSDLVFEKEVVEVRSTETAMREFQERVDERYDYASLPFTFTFLEYLKFGTLLLVYWNAYSYMKNYASDTSYDNIYIDNSLKKMDSKAEETIFPLNFKDQKKYVIMDQKTMSSDER